MQIRKGKDLLCSLGETSSKRSVIKKSDVPWEPPPFGWLKVNVDDAYTKKTGKAGAGIIIRNHFGEVLLSAWKVLHDARSAEEVEAYACLEGVSLAVEWGREKTILESDCLPIINSLISHVESKSSLFFLIKEIKLLSASLPELRYQVIRREQNLVAYELCTIGETYVSYGDMAYPIVLSIWLPALVLVLLSNL
jgi:ribonuclease HI